MTVVDAGYGDLLGDTAGRIAAAIGTTTVGDTDPAGDDGWPVLVDAGLVGLAADTAAGPNTHDLTVVVEALGRSLARAPYLGCSVLPAALLAAAGAHDLLAELAAGRVRLGVALDRSLLGLAGLGDGAVAWDAAGATAAIALGPSGDGHRLVALPVRPAATRSTDLTRHVAATAAASTATVRVDGGVVDAAALARWEATALVVLAADLLGVMDGALAKAVKHVRDRRQFGVPVGSFQAVQHMAADAAVTVAGARAIVHAAAAAVDTAPPDAALTAARTAKAWCSQGARAVTETAIQMQGGIGVTWEDTSHLFLRRAHLDALTLGDEVHHLHALAGGDGR